MPSLSSHLESKTVIGFTVLLLTIVGLALAGKLNPEAVDAIKWLGGSFFAVRAVANYAESKGPPQGEA